MSDDGHDPKDGGSASTVARLDPVIGSEVSGYRVTSRLGVGGMGIVYEGEQPVIGKRVAIKVLRHEVADNPDVVQRLVSEARAVNKVGHRGIIDVFGFGQLPDGRQCIVMEYLDGEPLEAVLRTYRTRRSLMPLYDALVILEEVLSGLAAAHEAGVIHRDLKPSNIFLCKQRDGTQFVKLLDFGIAKLGVLGHTPATRASIMVGTPAYMAPEQASGGLVGPALDLYAIGCLAFELLTGRTPFEENSVVEMLVSHATKKPPHVATLNMGVPDELDSLVDQLLSKNPADRPASAEVVRREVARIRKGLADTTGRRLSVEIEAPPATATLVDPPRAPSAPAPSRASKPIPPPPQANDTLLKPLDPELAPAESLVSTSILPKNARPSAPEQRAPTAPSLPPVDEEVLVAPKSKLPLVVAGVVAVAAGVGLVLAFNGPGRPDAPPPGAGGVKTARVDPPPPNPTVTPTAEPPAPPGTPPAPVEPPAPGPAVAPAAPAAVELAPARPAPVARAAPPGPPAPAVPPPAPQPAPPPREALPTRPTAPSPVAPAPKVERSAPPAPEARSAPSANPAVAKLQARAKKLEAALARLQANGEDVTMNARLVTKVRQQLATPGLSRDDLDSLEAALNRIESELAP